MTTVYKTQAIFGYLLSAPVIKFSNNSVPEREEHASELSKLYRQCGISREDTPASKLSLVATVVTIFGLQLPQ
jgi:hypothetical protein